MQEREDLILDNEFEEEIDILDGLNYYEYANKVLKIDNEKKNKIKEKNDELPNFDKYTNTHLNKKKDTIFNNVYQNLLYKNQRIIYLTSALKKELNIDPSGDNHDERSLENFALLLGSKKKDLSINKVNEFDDECINLILEFSKFPKVSKEYKNDEKYMSFQNAHIKPYLDALSEFYLEDVMSTLKKYDYNIDINNMDEEDIYTLLTATALTQDYYKKNTEEYLSYFENKFNTYDKELDFNKVGQIVNAIGGYVVHQFVALGFKVKTFGLSDYISKREEGERLYEIKSIQNCAKFYTKDNTKIDCYVGELLENDENVLIRYDNVLTFHFLRFFPACKITNDVYVKRPYSSIYIDGKSIYELVKEDKKDSYEQLSVADLNKEVIRKYISALKSADKVVEYANVSSFKNTFTVNVVPLVFKYADPELNAKYQTALQKSLTNKDERHKNIIEKAKETIKNYENGSDIMPYKDYEYVSSAQREINKFNDYIDELVFEYSDNNINNREFKKFYNEVLKDFNSKEHTAYLLDEFSEGIDDSQIFKNRDILKNYCLDEHKMYDFGVCLQKYIVSDPKLIVAEPINRDLMRYFMSLKDKSFENRMLKTLKYVLSIQKRDCDINNRDFSLTREICNELISDFMDNNISFDMNIKDNINNLYTKVNAAFMIGQLFDSDKEYAFNLKINNPKLYYKLSESRSYYEALYANTKDEVKALTGVKNINDKTLETSLVSYSLGCDTLFSDNINVSRNKAGLTKLYLEHSAKDFKAITLDVDVSLYGLYGRGNDLEYENLEDNDVSAYIESIENMKNIDLSMLSTNNITNISKRGLSALNVKVMLNDFKDQLMAGNDLLKDVLLNGNYKDYLYNQLSINGRSLNELANEYIEANKDKNVDKDDVVSAYFAKALNSPSDIITHTTLKFSDNSIKTDTVVVNKNYKTLANRCKDSHTTMEKAFHFLKLYTYDEEKKIKIQNSSISVFEKTNGVKNVNDKFYNKYKAQIDLFNIKLTNKMLKQPLEVKEVINEVKHNNEMLKDNAKLINKINNKQEIK